MARNTRYVCGTCGHVEIRSLAPLECPNCSESYLLDAEMMDDDISESDLADLIDYHMAMAE